MSKDELIQNIIENLTRCQRPALHSSLTEFGLSHAQGGMLYLLSYHKQASVKQISEFLGITKSAVSQLMDPLTQKNLVSRHVDPADRRIVWLRLTNEGSQLLKKLVKNKFAGLRSGLESLNEAELKTLYDLHKKMADNI